MAQKGPPAALHHLLHLTWIEAFKPIAIHGDNPSSPPLRARATGSACAMSRLTQEERTLFDPCSFGCLWFHAQDKGGREPRDTSTPSRVPFVVSGVYGKITLTNPVTPKWIEKKGGPLDREITT